MSRKARRDPRFRLKGIWKFPQTQSGGTGPVPALWYGATLLLLTAVYFGTARFGLSLGAFSGFAALVWVPSGIAVASLFLWRYRLWPAITLGAFLVNFFTGAHLFVAIGISIGNTLEALVCTALLKREGVRPALDSLHDILALVLVAAPLSALISATIGVSSLWFGGNLVWSSAYVTWGAWWLGDVSSLLLLSPLLLTWSQWPHPTRSSKRLIELGLFSACLLVIGLFLFLRPSSLTEKTAPTTYLVFPPLIWAALRFGPRGATSALVALSSFAVVGTILGVSPFSIGNLGERLFFLQGFMTITAATTLILAAVTAERYAFEQRKDAFLSMVSHELRSPLSTRAYFCAQIILTPLSHKPFSVSQVTISKVLSSVGAATQQVNAATPPCGRSSPPGHAVVDGWRRDERTRDTPQNPCVRSSRLHSLPQLSRSYDLPPPPASTRSLRMPTEQGRPTLDSTIWCWLMLSVVCQDELTPTPTTVRQHKIDPLFMLDLLPLAPPDDPSCGSSGHEWG